MRSLIIAVLVASVPAVALAHDGPAPAAPATAATATATATAATVDAAASSTPRAVSQASEGSRSAPRFVARGRKIGSPFGYMKQANDDPQGLARIQDQARQLRPQL